MFTQLHLSLMEKVKIPRKLKKKLKLGIWFYPLDEVRRTRRLAFPYKYKEDFLSYKSGLLENLKKS